MRPAVAVVAFLLLAGLPVIEAAPGTQGLCLDQAEAYVPCGYIYPRLLIDYEKPETPPTLGDAPLVVEATLAYEFDPMAEGVALDDPGNPIVVTFEFPKRPEWAGISVEPKEVPIPIQPQYLRPDPSDPADPQMTYRYETDITITIESLDRAVLPDGRDDARLFVFAKSTESGLYKPGYGIRELKVAPLDPLHVSDLGPQTVVETVDSLPFDLVDVTVPVGPGLSAVVDLPDRGELWRPMEAVVSLDGPEAASPDLMVAVVDAEGGVIVTAGPAPAPLAFNVTLPNAGPFRFVVHADGGGVGPVAGAGTLEVPPPPEGKAYRMPKDYRVTYRGSFDAVAANSADPAAQDEVLIPFAVYDGAQSADISVTLTTPNAPVDRGAANVNLNVLGPDGTVLQTGTVDPLNPAKRFPVGGLPGEGLYGIRVFGTGVPDGAEWNVILTVVYDSRALLTPVDVPWRMAPGRLGAHNATIEAAPEGAWSPTPVRLVLEGAGDGQAAFDVTILDEAGVPRFASGRGVAPGGDLAADVTFPRPGVYTAVFHGTASKGSSAQWGTGIAVGTVTVGDPTAPTFVYPTAYAATASASLEPMDEGVVALWSMPVFDGAEGLTIETTSSAPATTTVRVVDDDGNEVFAASSEPSSTGTFSVVADALDPGMVTVLVTASADVGATFTLSLATAYAAAPVEANPFAPDVTVGEEDDLLSRLASRLSVPGPGLLVVVVGLLAVAAVARRR